MKIQEVLAAAKLLEKLLQQVAEIRANLKAHAEEIEDEEARDKLLDAVERGDIDFIRKHLFLG